MIRYYLVLILASLTACNQPKINDNKTSNELISHGIELNDTITYGENERNLVVQMDTSKFVQTLQVQPFQRIFLDSLVNSGNGEFETDSIYKISFVKNYIPYPGDTVFYIKGYFLPSLVNFHYYGGYNSKDLSEEVYHLPVRTWFKFTKFEIRNNEIRIYGVLSDEHSEGEGEMLLFNLNH